MIPKGFFPDEDTGQIFAITEAAQDISFDAMREHQHGRGENRRRRPERGRLHVGHWRRRRVCHFEPGPHVHALEGPRSERKLNANQVIQELRPKLAQVPGINVYMQNPPLIRVGGMLTKALYQYSLQDTDMNELFHWAPILMDKMAEQQSRVSGRDQRFAHRQSAGQRGD